MPSVFIPSLPNNPIQAPQSYIDKMSHIKDPKRRTYAAMVTALDDSVGEIIEALNNQGMLKNSIIVFSSDNGGPTGGFGGNFASNYPLRGCKRYTSIEAI